MKVSPANLTPMSATPAEVRQKLIDALQLDLIGPTPTDAAHAAEILAEAPSQWYLTAGFLVPYEATPHQRRDDTANDDLDLQDRPSHGDDDRAPEAASSQG